MKSDVLVLGAGLGGLQCAYILARAGLHVRVLEQGSRPGGCLQSYRRRGLSYDTGFHYVGGLGEGQSLHAVFAYLGLLDLPWQRMDDAFDHVLLEGRTFPLMQGFDAFVSALAEEFPSERDALRRYGRLLQRVARHSPLWDDGGVDFSVSLSEAGAWPYLEETFRNPLLRQVLSGNGLRMELRRESLPLFTFAHCHAGYVESSWRLRGGGALLAEALARGIRSCGGEVLCNARVDSLREAGGRITAAVCADGRVFEADRFVSSLHPSVACPLLKDSRWERKAYFRRVGGLENTFGFCTVSLRLKPGVLRYFNHNRYVYASSDVWDFWRGTGPVSGVLASCNVPETGDGYVRQVDLLTPMEWECCQAWEGTAVGRRGADYEALKSRLADECAALASRGIPGLEAMVEGRYVSTPLTWRDYTGTPGGSAYGVRKDYRNPLLTMLSPRTPLPNLWLTGQSLQVHGVHGVTMTALATCAEILGREWIKEHVLMSGVKKL